MGRISSIGLAVAALLLTLKAHAEDAWMFDPSFRVPRADEIVSAGPPPLLRGQVDAYVDLVHAAFDLSLSRGHERALRDAIEVTYGTMDADARQAYAASVAPLGGLRLRARAGDGSAVAEGLREVRRQIDLYLQTTPDSPITKALKAALRCRGVTSWPGSPPVHGCASNAYLEMVEFIVSLGRNEDLEPTSGQREILRRDLATTMLATPRALRVRLVDVHRVWLRLKGKWDRSLVADRLRLRWEAIGLLARAMPAERRVTAGSEGDLTAYARAAHVLRTAETGYAAWSNLSRHPEAVLSLVDGWLGAGPPGAAGMLLYR